MHTIKRRGFIDTKASRLLVVAPLVHRYDIYSLLTTILSLIAQYQLNHVPPDSSYSLFLCTSLYIRTSQFDRSLLLNVLANLQGNFRGFCCRNSFSNSRKNIRLFLRCKYRIHDRIILRKIQE